MVDLALLMMAYFNIDQGKKMKNFKLYLLVLLLANSAFFLVGCQKTMGPNIKLINNTDGRAKVGIEIEDNTFIVVPLSSSKCCDTSLDNCIGKDGYCPSEKPITVIEP